MYLEEAAIAAGSSLIVFTVFSIQAVMQIAPTNGFPRILRQLMASRKEVGRRSPQWRAAVAAGLFAAIGQLPVLVVLFYRGDALGIPARLVLVGELLASITWLALLQRWRRAAPPV